MSLDHSYAPSVHVRGLTCFAASSTCAWRPRHIDASALPLVGATSKLQVVSATLPLKLDFASSCRCAGLSDGRDGVGK